MTCPRAHRQWKSQGIDPNPSDSKMSVLFPQPDLPAKVWNESILGSIPHLDLSAPPWFTHLPAILGERGVSTNVQMRQDPEAKSSYPQSLSGGTRAR